MFFHLFICMFIGFLLADVFFLSIVPSTSAFLLIHVGWAVFRADRSRCDDPYLIFWLYSSVIAHTILFLSPTPTHPVLVAFFLLSALQSFFHSLSSTCTFFSSAVSQSILTCPRYSQIACMCGSHVYLCTCSNACACLSPVYVFTAASVDGKSEDDKTLQTALWIYSRAVDEKDVAHLFVVFNSVFCI